MLGQSQNLENKGLSRVYLQRNLFFFFIFAFIYIILNLFSDDILIHILNSDLNVKKIGDFLRLQIGHSLIFAINDMLKSILISMKIFKVHIIFSSFSLIWYLCLIFYFVHHKELGLTGLAYTDLLNDLFVFIMYTTYIIMKKREKFLLIFKKSIEPIPIFNAKKLYNHFIRLIQLSSFLFVSLLTANINVLLLASNFKSNDIAAYNTASVSTIPLLIYAFIIEAVSAIYIAKAAGSSDSKKIISTIFVIILFTFISAHIWIALYFGIENIYLPLLSSNKMMNKEIIMTRLYVGAFQLESMRMAISGILLGLGKEKYVLYMNIYIYGIFMLLFTYFGGKLIEQIEIIYYSINISNFIACITGIYGIWKLDLDLKIKEIKGRMIEESK